MKTNRKRTPALKIRDLCDAMEAIAPTELAQTWDNVGLLAGDELARLRRIHLCVDLTDAVVREAAAGRADAVVAYHPPLFKPVSSLRMASAGAEAHVFECVRRGIAVYSPHTALDASAEGTNDVLARICGLEDVAPLEFAEPASSQEVKVVTFVPSEHVERVASAMFDEGAGRIGDYAQCSFRIGGQGTFCGGESTQPAVGRRGRLEVVNETRLELVAPPRALPAILGALRGAHPYEEPAVDIYPLKIKPVPGIGRVGTLRKPQSLGTLAGRIKRWTRSTGVQIVGKLDSIVSRAIVVAGSAGTLPMKAIRSAADAIVTGEIRHHDALTYARMGCRAVAVGHWASERPVLDSLFLGLSKRLPGVQVRISRSDRDPFTSV